MIRTRPLPSVVLILIGVLLAGAGSGPVQAQSGIRSVGAVATGGGTSALDTGTSALYANPAGLTTGSVTHNLEVQLLRTSFYLGGGLYQFNHYNNLFVENQGPPLSDKREKAILNDWFGQGKQSTATYIEVMPFALSYRPDGGQWGMALGLRTRTIQKAGTDKGLFDLLLRGTSPARTVPLNVSSRLYSTVDVTGAFSYRLASMPLSVGVSPSFIIGLGYADMNLSSTVNVSSDSVVHRFDYRARAAGAPSTAYDEFDPFGDELIDGNAFNASGPAGTGVGFDLGATYTVRPGLHASVSITDLGRIWWNDNPQTVRKDTTFRYDGVNLSSSGEIGEQIESDIDTAYTGNRDRSSFATGLPTTLHMSSTWDSGVVVLNGGISVGLNQAAGAVPDPMAVHLGGKLDVGPFPLRLGVRALGTQAVTLSGGFGLDFGFYRMDVGASVTPSTSTLGSGGRYAVSISLGTVRI